MQYIIEYTIYLNLPDDAAMRTHRKGTQEAFDRLLAVPDAQKYQLHFSSHCVGII